MTFEVAQCRVMEGGLRRRTPDLCETCFDGRGYLWPHSTNDRTDHSYVERCDGCSRFESDDDAARYIVARLSAQGVKFTASWADVGLSAGQPYVDLTEE